MRVVASSTINRFAKNYPRSADALAAWLKLMNRADWNSPQDLKKQVKHASIISGKRVVFNIGGNNFRLLVDIEYKFQTAFVVWYGTHTEYDNIDVKTQEYD